MPYTEADLDKLIKSVEAEFTAHLDTLAKSESEVEALAKGEFPAKKEEKKPEDKEESKKEEPKKEDHKESKPEAKEGEKESEGEHKPEESKPEGEKPAQGDDHCDYDEQDMDHMHKMYMSMSKGELKAHHDSCRAALEGRGMAKCGEMSMGKSETDTTVEVKAEIVNAEPNKELELAKSELATANAKLEALQKNMDALSSFLTKLVEKKGAPQARAITSLDVIAKSENGGKEEKTLAKSDIDAILTKKSQDPKLEKSDREAINAYYLNGASINSISHLLK